MVNYRCIGCGSLTTESGVCVILAVWYYLLERNDKMAQTQATKKLAISAPYSRCKQDRLKSYKDIDKAKSCDRWIVLDGVSSTWTAVLASKSVAIDLNEQEFGGDVEDSEALANLEVLSKASNVPLKADLMDGITFVDYNGGHPKVLKQDDADTPICGVIYFAADFEPARKKAQLKVLEEQKAKAEVVDGLLTTAWSNCKTKAQWTATLNILKVEVTDEMLATLQANDPKDWS